MHPAGVITQPVADALEAEADAIGWLSPYVPGTQTVEVTATLDDWQAADQHVVSHKSGNAGWFVDVHLGDLRYGWGDGTTTHSVTSTGAIPMVDGDELRFRVTLDPEPVSGPATVTFEYHDGNGWVLIDTINHTSTTAVVDAAGAAHVGKTDGLTGLEADVAGIVVSDDVGVVWSADYTLCDGNQPSSCTLDGRVWSANAAAGFRNPGLGGIETVFTHDPATGGPHAVASRTVGGSTASYSYDAVGNMVGVTEGASSTTLGWDARNRLSSWSDGTSTHTFSYDAAGERVSSSDGTLTTIFLGDVEVGSDGTDRTLYRFARGLVAIRTTTGTSTTLELVVTDHLGSPHVTFDPVTQAVTGTRLHRPYGVTRDQTGAMPGTVGFTGQHQDPTGLAYYGARYYDPALMVFISADTIIPDPSIPADLNRYGYVRGNPVGLVDLAGHFPMPWHAVAGILAHAVILPAISVANISAGRYIAVVDQRPSVWGIPRLIAGPVRSYYKPDLLDPVTNMIWELKPNTPSGFQSAQRDIRNYVLLDPTLVAGDMSLVIPPLIADGSGGWYRVKNYGGGVLLYDRVRSTHRLCKSGGRVCQPLSDRVPEPVPVPVPEYQPTWGLRPHIPPVDLLIFTVVGGAAIAMGPALTAPMGRFAL